MKCIGELLMAKPSVFVKIPRERVGVLIGLDGHVKETVEKKFSVSLQVDSEAGDVTITQDATEQDPTVLLRAREVVTAIGRGFSPERAFRLFEDEDIFLEVIDLREIVGRSLSDIKRLEGRVIGKAGKTRKIIEELTETYVSVYGYTISIIGGTEKIEAAREAISMLIRGSQHSTVYRFLHKKRRELKKKKLELWETPYEKLEK
jgi:ribosomal RNA assembly protein